MDEQANDEFTRLFGGPKWVEVSQSFEASDDLDVSSMERHQSVVELWTGTYVAQA